MLRVEGTDLRFVEFMALIAGLIGIATAIFPIDLKVNGIPFSSIFILMLVGFMFYSVVAYAGILRGKSENRFYVDVSITFFSALMALAISSAFTETVNQFQPPLSESTIFIISCLGYWAFFNVVILWRYRWGNDSS